MVRGRRNFLFKHDNVFDRIRSQGSRQVDNFMVD
jgi:hypothetical protein